MRRGRQAGSAAEKANPEQSPPWSRQRLEQGFRPEERAEGTAGSTSIGLSGKHWGVSLPIRAEERVVGQRRPVQGNSPDDRKTYPDFRSPQESLRRCPPARSVTRTVLHRQCALAAEPRGPDWRFQGMTESIAPMRSTEPSEPGGRAPPPVGRPPGLGQGRGGRNCSASCSSFATSSDRLFIDRVARQQSPSLLHRRPQNSTHFPTARATGDVSTFVDICDVFDCFVSRSVISIDRFCNRHRT